MKINSGKFSLKLKKPDAAPKGYGEITTKKAKIYKTNKVPFLHLVDTKGIELDQLFSINRIGTDYDEFINEQLKKNNINEVVHCIWYCLESDHIQKTEYRLNNYEKTIIFQL